MKFQNSILITILISIVIGCSKNSEQEIHEEKPVPEVGESYFPPLNSDNWDTVALPELNWNIDAVQPLHDFLEEKDTKAFLILKDGKIAMEEYYGTFTKDSLWYWASAGKTLTAFTVGIAKANGFLSLDDKTSDYLGIGWTSTDLEEENQITIKNQLTMTTGLNDLFFDCVAPDCLEYKADANTRWAYHNGPYTLLQSVVSSATNMEWSTYFNTELRNKIGMNGIWVSTNGSNNVYFSNARSMARFGLLNLNNGAWDKETILGDANYIDDMKSTSQELNKSYGYLWWLNGKEEYRIPASQQVFTGNLIPNAPEDAYAGLGKNDQKLYIVPSANMVVVRLGGETSASLLGPSSFDNELWEKINAVTGN